MLFGKLLPREGNFFEMLNEHGTLIASGARSFMELIRNYGDATLREKYAAEVDAAERAADKITAEVNRALHKTFITPIDREQIHGLINALDDVLDLLQDSAETLSLYDVRTMPDDAIRLGDLSVKCCERVQHAVSLLPRISEASVAEAALKTCEEIDRLESDADRVMRSAISRLFRDEKVDTRELIKLKAVYEHLESITDRCEDVANVIEGVVLENYARNTVYKVPPIPSECELLRIHVSGDFDRVEYIEQWIARLTERPDVTAWAYTRSWRVPELLPALERLRALPNMQLFASMDKSIDELPPAGWRRAWIDGDERAGTPVEMTAPGETVISHRNFVTVDGDRSYLCPEETKHKKDCVSCGYCFEGQKHDVTFLKH
jgi:hypothetical protein